MNIWVLLAGDFHPPGVWPQAEDVVIAVDGGMRHAAALARTPDVWLGDFDSSAGDAYADIPRLAYPADKTQTDFELALAYANAQAARAIVHIIGSHGNEADHSFANLWVLPQSRHPLLLWQENACIISAHGACTVRFAASRGSKISLFALTALHGISTQGLRWPLDHADLAPHQALAARNEMAADRAEVQWQTGCALLFLPAQAQNIEISHIL